MPPSNNNSNKGDLGWKFFFATLMVIQVIGVGILWRTYDAITETRSHTAANTLKITEIIYPKITDHETRIKKLEEAKP
jgi:hypothetical protein